MTKKWANGEGSVFGRADGRVVGVYEDANSKTRYMTSKTMTKTEMKFHDLRHSCIPLLLARGILAKVVSETVGHADVSITLLVYGHMPPEMQSTAADGIDEAQG